MQTYRRDIDGLRAVAVGAVVLSHAAVPGMRGGFLGVDIFFVISGFLITGVLAGSDGTLGQNLVQFYERRVRRIAPALIVVLAAASAAATLLLSPLELRNFALSLQASTAFAANLFFMQRTDYFNPQFDTPLLHLWSLGVEEQFYIVYPLALWAVSRWARRLLIPLLVITFVLSLTAALWLFRLDSQAAFYSPGARAFELILGALAALLPLRIVLPRWAAEGLAALALGLIVAAISFYGFRTAPWQPLPALAAAAGTALALSVHDGRQTFVSRVLRSSPMVAIGLISYSLYLWHWPLFQFYQRFVLRPPTPAEYGMLIAAAMLIAVVSWHFVEQPFRRPGGIGRRTVFALAGAFFAAFIAISTAAVTLKGLPQRFPPEVARINSYMERITLSRFDTDKCFVRPGVARYDFARCFRPAAGQANVVLWGDSHARNYLEGLRRPMQASGIQLINATYAGCQPELGRKRNACQSFNRALFDKLDKHIAAVIVTGQYFRNRRGLVPLAAAVDKITAKGIRVVVLGPSLEFFEPEPLYLARYAQTGDADVLAAAQALNGAVAALDDAMRQRFAGKPLVTYVSVFHTVCPKAQCPLTADNIAIAFDRSHLTYPASLAFGALLWPRVRAGIGGP